MHRGRDVGLQAWTARSNLFRPLFYLCPFYAYLFERKNPRGIHFERWLHSYGCGKWFHVARCTKTMEVFGTYSAQEMKPPKKILDAIKKKLPNGKNVK